MPRFLGSQNGGLRKTSTREPKWEANWYAYLPDGKRKRRVKMIGTVADMTEAKAKQTLRELIVADNRIATGVFAEKTGIIPTTLKSSDGLSKIHTGLLAELAVSMDLLTKGWEVFRPLSPGASCDLIGVRGPDTIRFEVKSAKIVGIEIERFRCDLRRNMGKFDVAAIVVFESGLIHYIQKQDIIEPSRPPFSRQNTNPVVGTCEVAVSNA